MALNCKNGVFYCILLKFFVVSISKILEHSKKSLSEDRIDKYFGLVIAIRGQIVTSWRAAPFRKEIIRFAARSSLRSVVRRQGL